MFEYRSPSDILHITYTLASAYAVMIINYWFNTAALGTLSSPYTSITTPNTLYQACSMHAPIL